MKTTSSKSLITIIIALAIVLLQISPAMAVSEKPSNNSPTTTSNTCTRIATLKTTNEAGLVTQIATMQTNFTTRIANINSNKATTDQKLATARLNAKNQFETKITAMLSQPELTELQLSLIHI